MMLGKKQRHDRLSSYTHDIHPRVDETFIKMAIFGSEDESK